MKHKKVVSILAYSALAISLVVFAEIEARAESSFFGNYCSGCHSNDTVSCNACHAHGVWQDSSRRVINLTATTDLDRYRPGQTVTVTFSGGYRTGWIRAILYDHNMQEVDRVTGPTGMGDDGSGSPAQRYPVTLAAPAPSTPGFYTWSASWFGAPFDKGNPTVQPHKEENVPTNTFEVFALPTCADVDGDSYEDAACNNDRNAGGGDCDDSDPSVNPGAQEACSDGVDNNCDGLIDSADPGCASLPPTDMDRDGYPADADCNDSNPAVNPGAREICGDGIDNDCDGRIDSADTDCVLSPPGDADDDEEGDEADDREADDDDDEKPAPTTNLISLHDSKSRQYDNQCVKCHGTMQSETSLDPFIPGAHQAMLPQIPAATDNDKCLHCHTTVDLREHSAGALRRQVNPNLCAACHSSLGPGRKLYAP
ncbi:putative metal-binding motif-containing protein [Candidatus Poribacteria bacterium]|nr:putative metal-binding motif-containing protein [Candidatus Poribacteria bacterium]